MWLWAATSACTGGLKRVKGVVGKVCGLLKAQGAICPLLWVRKAHPCSISSARFLGLPFPILPLPLGEAGNSLGCGGLSWLWSRRQSPRRDPALWEQLCKDTARAAHPQAPSSWAQNLTCSHTFITGSNLPSSLLFSPPCFAVPGPGWPWWHKVTVVAAAWS